MMKQNSATMRHSCTYAMLKAAGHDPLKAAQILLDAQRGDHHAIWWIKALFRGRLRPFHREAA